MRKRGAAFKYRFQRTHYIVVAEIINNIEDEAFRKQVADHFATEFNKRSKAFDPARWYSMTGGVPAANSAKED